MARRALLLIIIVLVIFPSAAGSSIKYSDCRACPGQQGLSTYIVRIVLRASGTVETSVDITFKPCRPAGERRISLEHPVGYSDYNAEIAVVQSGERRSIPIENTTAESSDPPFRRGGTKMRSYYLIPPLQPGDELHETIRASVPAILSQNQFLAQTFEGIQHAFAYTVIFESERTDVTTRLLDPAKFLVQVVDVPTRKEWQSEWSGSETLPAPRLEITTLADWAKVAEQARAVYFMDAEKLQDLQAASIQPGPDPEGLFKELTFHFGPKFASETGRDPPSLVKILQAKGGDCKALTFLLLNLLRWAGVDAELVLVSIKKHELNLTDVFSYTDIDHMLVYVPSLDRYFDPTLPAGGAQQWINRMMRSKNRIHVAGPADGKMYPPPACADYCLLAGSGRPIDDPFHAIRVRTETIRGYPSPRPGTGVNAPP
jgi:hypothetical protein